MAGTLLLLRLRWGAPSLSLSLRSAALPLRPPPRVLGRFRLLPLDRHHLISSSSLLNRHSHRFLLPHWQTSRWPQRMGSTRWWRSWCGESTRKSGGQCNHRRIPLFLHHKPLTASNTPQAHLLRSRGKRRTVTGAERSALAAGGGGRTQLRLHSRLCSDCGAFSLGLPAIATDLPNRRPLPRPLLPPPVGLSPKEEEKEEEGRCGTRRGAQRSELRWCHWCRCRPQGWLQRQQQAWAT